MIGIVCKLPFEGIDYDAMIQTSLRLHYAGDPPQPSEGHYEIIYDPEEQRLYEESMQNNGYYENDESVWASYFQLKTYYHRHDTPDFSALCSSIYYNTRWEWPREYFYYEIRNLAKALNTREFLVFDAESEVGDFFEENCRWSFEEMKAYLYQNKHMAEMPRELACYQEWNCWPVVELHLSEDMNVLKFARVSEVLYRKKEEGSAIEDYFDKLKPKDGKWAIKSGRTSLYKIPFHYPEPTDDFQLFRVEFEGYGWAKFFFPQVGVNREYCPWLSYYGLATHSLNTIFEIMVAVLKNEAHNMEDCTDTEAIIGIDGETSHATVYLGHFDEYITFILWDKVSEFELTEEFAEFVFNEKFGGNTYRLHKGLEVAYRIQPKHFAKLLLNALNALSPELFAEHWNEPYPQYIIDELKEFTEL